MALLLLGPRAAVVAGRVNIGADGPGGQVRMWVDKCTAISRQLRRAECR